VLHSIGVTLGVLLGAGLEGRFGGGVGGVPEHAELLGDLRHLHGWVGIAHGLTTGLGKVKKSREVFFGFVGILGLLALLLGLGDGR